jgi:hypothetical protein
MESLLLKKRIYQVQAPPETLEGWEDELQRLRGKWGQFFKNNEEFEYFVMLPLTDEQRHKVIRDVGAEARFKKEIRECTGKKNSSPEHRKYCLSCCLLDRCTV